MISIRHYKGVSHDQIPIAARFENADLRDAVTQPKYNYSVQICYTMLLMHWATKQISPTIVIAQNGYLLPHILVSYPLSFTKFPL